MSINVLIVATLEIQRSFYNHFGGFETSNVFFKKPHSLTFLNSCLKKQIHQSCKQIVSTPERVNIQQAKFGMLV